MPAIQRALISVSDKNGIVGFARGLADAGVEILSTGGTAKLLAENAVPVTEVFSRGTALRCHASPGALRRETGTEPDILAQSKCSETGAGNNCQSQELQDVWIIRNPSCSALILKTLLLRF